MQSYCGLPSHELNSQRFSAAPRHIAWRFGWFEMAEPAFDLRRRIGKWSSECTANARCPDLPPCGPAADLPGWAREGRITLIHVKLMSDGHRLNRAFFAFTIDLIQRRRRDAPRWHCHVNRKFADQRTMTVTVHAA